MVVFKPSRNKCLLLVALIALALGGWIRKNGVDMKHVSEGRARVNASTLFRLDSSPPLFRALNATQSPPPTSTRLTPPNSASSEQLTTTTTMTTTAISTTATPVVYSRCPAVAHPARDISSCRAPNFTLTEEQTRHLATCPRTHVSVYYEIPSKVSVNAYDNRIRHFVSTKLCLVLFSEDPSHPRWASLDANYTLHIKMPLCSLATTLNLTTAEWTEQYHKDPECGIHRGYQLYWVWAVKTLLLTEMATRNPFKSDQFFYADVGSLRYGYHDNQNWRGNSFARLKDGFYIGDVANSKPQVLDNARCLTARRAPQPPSSAGAAFGGLLSSIVAFHHAYRLIFQSLLKRGIFIGKDQGLFDTVCYYRSSLCNWVPKSGGWFHVMTLGVDDNTEIPFMKQQAEDCSSGNLTSTFGIDW